MLSSILSLFRKSKTISLNNLSIHFSVDKSAMKSMLVNLENKGYINEIHFDCTSCHSNCATCTFAKEDEFYRLIIE